jgi:TonB family protein
MRERDWRAPAVGAVRAPRAGWCPACRLAAAAALFATASCGDVKRGWDRVRSAEVLELPALATPELPFRYPPALFVLKVPGDVTLRLHVDSLGRVVPESTQIAEHATHVAFDSAALEGAPRLRFRPARRGERHVGHTVLFPIRFRVPGVPPAPQDTMGRR